VPTEKFDVPGDRATIRQMARQGGMVASRTRASGWLVTGRAAGAAALAGGCPRWVYIRILPAVRLNVNRGGAGRDQQDVPARCLRGRWLPTQ
jgi:hypothetical protein